MRAAFDRIDIVGEGKNIFRVAVIPLHSDFDVNVVFFTFKVDNAWMHGGFGPIQMFDERQEPALVEKLMFLLASLVFNGNLEAAVQERQFTQPLRKNIETEFHRFENLRVGFKGDSRPTLFGLADLLKFGLRFTPPIVLLIDSAVPLDL